MQQQQALVEGRPAEKKQQLNGAACSKWWQHNTAVARWSGQQQLLMFSPGAVAVFTHLGRMWLG